MSTEEMLKELLRQTAENNKAIIALRESHDKLREDYYRIERIALEDNEYVRGQKRIISQINQMMPIEADDAPWLSPTSKRIFRVVGNREELPLEKLENITPGSRVQLQSGKVGKFLGVPLESNPPQGWVELDDGSTVDVDGDMLAAVLVPARA